MAWNSRILSSFVGMKHFKVILTAICLIFIALFTANVIFMVQLYESIKERYISDVEQCLNRADHIEMIDRIVDAGFGADDDVVWIQLGLQKSDVDDIESIEDLYQKDYSQGYRRVDRQLLRIVTQYLHDHYGDSLGELNVGRMEKAFRLDLNYSGFYPESVHIVEPGATFEHADDLWEIVYRIDDDLTYYAYISPLTGNILGEMSGVIVTSVLIALALMAGFGYLIYVIRQQRTIEEMKDDFTNNMTHELKTPIAIAYAANDSLLQFPESANEERTKRYLTAALDQLSKLAGLVENILAMSMERRRHLTMAKEKIVLDTFLRAIIEQQKLRAGKVCDITLECGEGATVEADPTHFSNVISNLLDNSIKYSGQEVSISIKADSDGVTVTDNGIGIPERSLRNIFDKFYRVPHGNRSDVRGYGIGLYYVKTVVDKHGWDITVTSKVGKGSAFTIKFTRENER